MSLATHWVLYGVVALVETWSSTPPANQEGSEGEPDEKTQLGPWEQFHRLRRERERLEDEARAAADRALEAAGLPSVTELASATASSRAGAST